MANEPERPIEKLLRAAAQKRRDKAGAPFELHPADRRLLQGEVARQFAQPGSRPFLEVLSRLWPRFAGGAAIFAVLALAVYVFLPVAGKGKPEALLAKNEPLPKAAPAGEFLPPAPTVPAPPAPAARVLQAERQPLAKNRVATPTDGKVKEEIAAATAPELADQQKAPEQESAASRVTPAPAPAEIANEAFQRRLSLAPKAAPSTSTPPAPVSPPPATTAPAAASLAATDESATLTGDLAGQPAVAFRSLPAFPSATRHAASPAAADDRLQSAGALAKKAGSAQAVQEFATVAPESKTEAVLADKVAPAPPVLASFQVQQAGSNLRITDADGSVYSGYVRSADAAVRRRAPRAEAPAAGEASRALGTALQGFASSRLDSDRPAPQTYSFRVTGTNRSLNQKVVFTGNLLAATNGSSLQPPTNALSFTTGVSGGRAAPAQPNLLPLPNLRISGKVVVGNGQPVELNAFPTSR